MIISHKHQFIYIKARKTAGTSIEIALSSICGKDDIITPISKKDEKVRKKLGFLGAQNYFIPRKKYTKYDKYNFFTEFKKAQFYNHIPCSEVINYVDKKTWNSYFKFTIERNPFDKVVSFYYWSGSDQKYNNISEFIADGGLRKIAAYDLYSINNVVAVDKIYKFENLNYFLTDLSERLNLEKVLRLPLFKAKSHTRKVKRYQDILDREAIEMIEIIFARELKLLNYQSMVRYGLVKTSS